MKTVLMVIFFGIMAVTATVTVGGIVWVGCAVKDLVYTVGDIIGEEPDTAVGDYAIGLMYEYGKGVDEDKAKAAEWYSMAAEKGNADAQFQLAGMYYKGEGVTQDCLESLKWLHEAAEQGHVDAYYKLGEVYRIGQGLRGNIQSVPEDRAESAKWYRKAADQGHVEAQMFLHIYAEEDEKAGVSKVW